MKLTRLLMATALFSCAVNYVSASGHVKEYKDPLLKTFVANPKQTADLKYQNQLRLQPSWQHFLKNNGQWSVIFNEGTGLPHNAFGTPVSMPGADARSVADNFFSSRLNEFYIPYTDLNFQSVSTSSKYHYVTYTQKHQGLDVLFSRVQIKMTSDYRVMQFGLDYFKNITLSSQPSLSPGAAAGAASNGVSGIISTNVNPALKILPVPAFRSYDFYLVYEVMVSNKDAEGIPGQYYTLVDANTGAVLYRVNKVEHFANTDINVTGTIYVTHPYNPSTVEPVINLKIVTNGNSDYTDATGYLGLSNTATVNATVSLQGLWSKVQTNNVTPSWSVTLNPGINNIDIDANTDIKQRSAYNSVNTVHDYMKSKFPLFTGMDNALPTNIDVAGSCNAFYDGSSINFFDQGGGCNPTSEVADVCYHEYGHGINDKFYQSQGFSFDNGAMGEGYADIWALGITSSPILGIGFFQNDPTGFVRRYDIDKKVYPQDLVGEVHADGEIIAGCWWDTNLNLGNLQQMMDLYKETFYAGLTGPSGTEGVLYQDILIEALTVDDNDGNLSNGTPNYCAITSAFAIHGITMGAAVALTHNEVLSATALAPVTVDATIQNLPGTSQVLGFYRIGNTGPFTTFNLTLTSGTNYQGTIPAQPAGTIIEYYLGIEDDCNTLLGIQPAGANDVDPNIPYYILVGFNEMIYDDFDNNSTGSWITGLPTDNNLTGTWIIDIPIPSYVGTSMVQTDAQYTAGGLFCAITGNAANAASPAGDNDVDGGATTLISPPLDLSSYTNPAITYYRWYSNDQGATPGTDFWQVSISGDNVNYVPVENTSVADHSWRRFAFKVLDYITPTSTVTLKFIAEDANAGSLIEAALDEMKVWDEVPTGIQENGNLSAFSVYPNPASTNLNISVGLQKDDKINVTILNNLGQVVFEQTEMMSSGSNLVNLDIARFASGFYNIRIITSDGTAVKKFNIQK